MALSDNSSGKDKSFSPGSDGEKEQRPVLYYARLYWNAGLNVVPLKKGTKGKPLIKWREYENKRVTEEEVEKWFKEDVNIAVVCGEISSNFITIDFDKWELFEKWRDYVSSSSSYSDLWTNKILNTWVVKTVRGVHIHFKLKTDKETFKRYKTVEGGGIDIKFNGLVAMPPSIRENGIRYEFMFGLTKLQEITEEELDRLIRSIEEATGIRLVVKRENATTSEGATRMLTLSQINEMINLILPFYKEGNRNELLHTFIAFLLKNNFSYESTKQFVKALVEIAKDEEAEDRLYLVDYHYKRRVKEIGKDRLRGYTGIRDVIERQLFSKYGDTDKAKGETLEVLRRLTEILGVQVEPKLVIAITKINSDFVQYFANDKKWGIALVTKKKDETTTEPILSYYIEKVKVQVNITDNTDRTYTIYLRNPHNNQVLVYSERKLGNIYERLERDVAGIRNMLKLKSAVSSIVGRFEEMKIAEIEEKAPSTGFHEINGELKYYETRLFPTNLPKADKGKAIEAIKKLGEILSFWDYKDQVIANIYFDIQSPLGHIRKQYGQENKILYNYGEPHVGKTFLERVYCAMWGLVPNKAIISGSNLTGPQLAYYMSITTFKIAVDEGINTWLNNSTSEMIKKSTTTYLVKLRLQKDYSDITEFEAYATLSFNANYEIPPYPGLWERIIPVKWSIKEKKSEAEFSQMLEKFNSYRDSLGYIGAYLKDMFIRRWKEIKPIIINNDSIEAGRLILEMMINELGIEKPEWVKSVQINYTLEMPNDIDIFFSFVQEELQNTLAKHGIILEVKEDSQYKRNLLFEEWEERLRWMAKAGILPSFMKLGRDNVYIFADVIDAIKRKKGYEIAGGLENLALKLGYKYDSYKGRRAIYIPILDLVERLVQVAD